MEVDDDLDRNRRRSALRATRHDDDVLMTIVGDQISISSSAASANDIAYKDIADVTNEMSHLITHLIVSSSHLLIFSHYIKKIGEADMHQAKRGRGRTMMNDLDQVDWILRILRRSLIAHRSSRDHINGSTKRWAMEDGQDHIMVQNVHVGR